MIVDQTTSLDASLRSAVLENADRLIKPGNAFAIASFSSFSQGRYLQILRSGRLEGLITSTQRDDVSVKLLRNFDACMAGQAAFGRKIAAEAIVAAIGGSSAELAKSDIMGSLSELSKRVKQSTARERIVFIISDMLEYSTISSFYANKNVRAIDPSVEMDKARAAHMIGDFGDARVFVLGAGLINESPHDKSASGVYRDPKTIGLLRDFWDAYFSASHAKLEQFGTPALLSPVR